MRIKLFVIMVVLMLLGALAFAMGVFVSKAQAQSPSTLVFGTNLGLYNGNDPFLVNSTFRSEMTTIGVHTIRMPERESGNPVPPSAIEIQAMQDIKNMGDTPLIILNGPIHPTALSDDINITKVAASIFGDSGILYEFGNEEDCCTSPIITIQNYTTGWNNIIAQIKALHPNDKYIGPVWSHYDGTSFRYFTSNASPKPDYISWHEYTCSPSTSDSECIANIAHYGSHIADYHTYSQTPILITEWNYDAVSDTRSDSFIQQWTQTAMEELIKDDVAGAYQYEVATSATEHLLNDNGTPTIQGSTFEAEYNKYFGVPTPIVSPTNTPNPTPTSTSTPTPSHTCIKVLWTPTGLVTASC